MTIDEIIKSTTNMSADSFFAMLGNMLQGCGQVLEIFALTIVFSIPLGILVALGRGSKSPLVTGPLRAYQLVFRGTPLMLQLIFFMYGPYFMFGITMNRFFACIFAFVINYAAFFGEIFRSGINSIPPGQYEAGKVLGYSKNQTFGKIILPQVVKRVIPPVGNEFMTLVKDTALAQIIAQPQLFDVASKAGSRHATVVPYIVAGVFYLIMNTVVEYGFKKLEERLDYYH